MAKGTMTQEDFEAGLSETSGFAGLKKAAKRDSPFGTGKVLPKKVPEEPAPSVQADPEPTPSKREAKFEKPARPAQAKDREASGSQEPAGGRSPAKRRFKDPSLEAVPFSFRVAYRDRADAVARSIQRRKRGMGGDRFTACTLYRVFSEIGLDHFEWRENDLVCTEAELKDLVCERLGLTSTK